MLQTHDRRRFLQTSLAAGSVLTLAGAELSHGEPARPAAATNPAARPGRVNWHADFAAACAAALRSGKPVFHFHMLGRLDEKFC
ncbi:MAG: hypothetical protein HY289_08740 [Planctomycetes bacterium]|nr:hypothetical protein [Planctomycetota bacterium]